MNVLQNRGIKCLSLSSETSIHALIQLWQWQGDKCPTEELEKRLFFFLLVVPTGAEMKLWKGERDEILVLQQLIPNY